MESERGKCYVCGREFVITRSGAVRSHMRDGKPCPGGGRPPYEGPAPSGNPNPHRAPLPTHTHRYEYADDDPGHSGFFCTVCGAQQPDQQSEERWTDPSAQPLGSTLRTPESASVAASSKQRNLSVTSKMPMSTKHRSAAATMTDVFESAAPVREKTEPERDRYGRYMLPHPATGKRQPWTRATTFAKSISDTFALSQWSQRMTLKGAALRPDLVALASTLDVKADKDRLNGLVEQAKDAAGQKVSANLGTAVHSFTEAVDAGESLDAVPVVHRPDVSAYCAALADAGLTTVPNLIERITTVPQLGVAGTFDRVLRERDGSYVVGDLKTGRDLQYGWQEIAIQLALYAHGVNQAGVWDKERKQWVPPRSYGDHPDSGPWEIPQVRTDYAIVMHLPVGEATCTLYRVDLSQGWAAAALCGSVRDWRKNRTLAQPYVVAEAAGSPFAEPVSVRPPTWAERFGAVSSRGEAYALWAEASRVVDDAELASLVAVARKKLTALEEQAG